MLSVERCRELLGAGLSDAELVRLRDELYALSTVAIEVARDRARASQRDTPDLRSRVARLEDVLVTLREAERADVIERASIIEFDGGRARDEAERLAVSSVLRRQRKSRARPATVGEP